MASAEDDDRRDNRVVFVVVFLSQFFTHGMSVPFLPQAQMLQPGCAIAQIDDHRIFSPHSAHLNLIFGVWYTRIFSRNTVLANTFHFLRLQACDRALIHSTDSDLARFKCTFFSGSSKAQPATSHLQQLFFLYAFFHFFHFYFCTDTLDLTDYHSSLTLLINTL